MNLIYLFMSYGAAPRGSISSWRPDVECSPKYTNKESGLYTEGTFYMFHRMLQEGIIDSLKVFYESNRGAGFANWGHGIKGYVVPEIRFVDEFIEEGDVIFARGGFRTWHDYLVGKKERGHWLLTYSANTGRQRWKWWDIVFWDLKRVNHVDRHERCWWYFKKPTHPSFFRPNFFLSSPKYDVCIGASHIHDKKGQWRTVRVLSAYKEMYGKNLKAVLPGAFRHGTFSTNIPQYIKDHNLDVDAVGMLPRVKMADQVYNNSKVFVYLGTSGQNDRAPLEALACGCQLVIASPNHHSPIVWENPEVSFVPEDHDNFKLIAKRLHGIVENYNADVKRNVVEYFQSQCGMDTVVLPEMRFLFDHLRLNPTPTLDAKRSLCKLVEERNNETT